VNPEIATLIGWRRSELDPAHRWLAEGLRPAVAKLVATQPERFDLTTLKVEAVGGGAVAFSVDGYAADHEAPHVFNVTLRGCYLVADGTAARVG
jgi:hypothetical protein